MLYLSFKVLHIVAVVVWIGSLLLLSFISSSENLNTSQLKAARKVSEAGIGLTWLAGIVLVLMASWYTATWWQIKVVLVVVISAIHSIMFRRWQRHNGSAAKSNSALPWALLALVLLVVSLVVFKHP